MLLPLLQRNLEEIVSSEMLTTYKAMLCHNPEDHNLVREEDMWTKETGRKTVVKII
jgi:hypothetical protein